MFYHVVIETTEKIGKSGNNQTYFELDKSDIEEIEKRVVYPFLRKEDIHFNGYFLRNGEIKRIAIKSSHENTETLVGIEYEKMRGTPVFMAITQNDMVINDGYTKDITTTIFDQAKSCLAIESKNHALPTQVKINALNNTKVFIVHGRDELAKTEAARFVEALGFSAIILHEQASGGKTIIEKIEEYTNVGFAIALYTPCVRLLVV